MTRLLKYAFSFALLPMLLTLNTGCQRLAHASETPTASLESEAPTITLVHPERQTLRRAVEQPGQFEGFERTDVVAKISGYVKKWYKDIGDPVKQDEVLAELWVPELVEELHQKEALVHQSEAEIVQAQRMLAAAEANLAKSEALLHLAEAGKTRAEASFVRWQSEMNRTRALVRTRATDEQSLDVTTDALKSAEAAVAESRANIQSADAARIESAAQRDKAKADIQVAESKLHVAQADCARTAATLGYATVKAPFAGFVTRRWVDTGSFLQPTASGVGQNLFQIVRTDKVRFFLDVPEVEAAGVRAGMPVSIRVLALDEQEIPGNVARTSWILDNVTRTLRTQVDLANADGRLRPGMYATARLVIEHRDVLTVPMTAVQTLDDQSFVMRVEDNKAVRTPVRLGLRQGPRVQVLKKQTRPAQRGDSPTWEDWAGTEQIVATNPGAISDGQVVPAQPDDRQRVVRGK